MIVSTVFQLSGLFLAGVAAMVIVVALWGLLITSVPQGGYYSVVLALIVGPGWGWQTVGFLTLPFDTDLAKAAAFGYGYLPTVLAIAVMGKEESQQTRGDGIYLMAYAACSGLLTIVPIYSALSSSHNGTWFWTLLAVGFFATLGLWAFTKDENAKAAQRDIAAANAKTINHGPAARPAADMPHYKSAPSSTHSDFDLPPQE